MTPEATAEPAVDVDRALAELAAQRRSRGLDPVTVVCPTGVAGIQLRRRLAAYGPFAAVRFETLPRLAELAAGGALASAGRRPLARPIGDHLAERVARSAGPPLGGIADLPGFARVLRRFFTRLRRAGIRDAAEAGPVASPHLAEVLRLYDRFRVATAGFYDEEDLLDAAADVGPDGPEAGDLYLVPPGPRTAAGRRFIAALRGRAPRVVEVAERSAVGTTRLALGPDPASEVREAAREVVRALEDGLGLHEVAVLHGADPAYPRMLREALEAAQVSAAVIPGLPLVETPAGRGVLLLLAAAETRYSRTAVMDALSLAPIRADLATADGRVAARVGRWDRISRRAGVTRGLERWRDALATHREDLQREIEVAAREEQTGREERARDDLQEGSVLLAVVEALAARLAALEPPQAAGTFVAALRALVTDYLRPDAQGLPEVLEEVDQLGAVDAVGGTFTLTAFAAALRANLEAAALRERRLGEGVLVADHRLAGGLRFRRVILCGAHDGALPAGVGPDPLVDDAAWRALRHRHPLLEDAEARGEAAGEAAMRALRAGDEIVVSAPLHEAGGVRERYPGWPMVDLATAHDAAVRTAGHLRSCRSGAWLSRPASPFAAMLSGPALDGLEVGMRRAVALVRARRDPGAGHPQARALEMLRARRSDRFTPWDGNLETLSGTGSLDVRSPSSPTRLEHYGACGRRYFLRSVLGLQAEDEPEERELMDPAARGALVHRVLERFFTEARGAGRPAPGEAWTHADTDRVREILDDEMGLAGRRGLAGLDVFRAHQARALAGDLVGFLEADSNFRRETGALPAELEARVETAGPDGMALHGYVDRIDRTGDGAAAWVIDYKTGSSAAFKGAGDSADPFAGGTRLQLPVYLGLAQDAERAEARYWFITRQEGYVSIPLERTPQVEARFADTLRAIAGGVRAGSFPAVPGPEDEWRDTFDNCRFCDYDRLCSRRRADELAAKVDDPGIGAWRAVAAAATGAAAT